MLRIGLTGGIGSGKSTVAELFRERGIETLDADRIARDLVAPGQPALAEIARLFGPEYVDGAGNLDRPRLGRLIFDSPQAREQLEALLHPLVYDAMAARIARFTGPYCVLEIPLLIETGRLSFVDRILVVDCPDPLRIARIKEKTGQDEAAIAKVLASQTSRTERLAWANDMVVNASDATALGARIAVLDRFYRDLASRR